jgi:hypothetical protein
MLTMAITQPPLHTLSFLSFLIQFNIYENFISTSFCVLYIYVHASLFGCIVFIFDWFQFFCSVKLTMNLHRYDIEHHDITHHDKNILTHVLGLSLFLNKLPL